MGVSPNPPWTQIGPEGEVTGVEAELVLAWAESINATISWVHGPESVLAEAMELDELDVIIGGLTTDSPYSDRIALTRPHATAQARNGSTDRIAIGVRPGENALMVSLERFVAERQGEL